MCTHSSSTSYFKVIPMRNILKTLLFAGALAFAAAPALAGTVVIVSASSPVSSISKSDLSALYLGKTSSLPNGSQATLYDLTGSAAVRNSFYKAVTGKTASQVKAIWSRLVFSGRAIPPRELSSSAAIVKAVASNSGALGYVKSSAVNSSVKVVFKVP